MSAVNINRNFRAGVLFSAIFVLFSAGRDVVGFVVLKQWPVPYVILGAIASTSLVAAIWSMYRKSEKSPYSAQCLSDLFWLNFTTAATWSGSFFAMARVVPSTLAAIVLGAIPLFTLFFDWCIRRKSTSTVQITSASVVLLGIILVSWNEILLRSDGGWSAATIGVLVSIVTSGFAATNNIFVKKMNDLGISPVGIFSSRFWLLILTSLIWIALTDTTIPTSSQFGWFTVCMIGILGIALPVFSLQVAISKIGPKPVGFLISLTPLVVFLIQYATGVHSKLEAIGIVGIILVCAGIYFGTKQTATSDKNRT